MGDLKLNGATSGTITVTPTAVAGTNTITLPASTGTVALTASPTFSGTTTVTTLTATTITSPASTALTFQYGGTTGATLDTSGNLLVGTTSATNSSNTFYRATGYCLTTQVNTTSGPTYHIVFNNPNGAVGSISTNGSTTTFSTSSDYRLKENVTPMTTGLAIISALKPVTYNWVNDKSPGEGFIAHELQAIIPHAVTGDKDAVNEDGNPLHQGVDYSKIVVHLVAACQELSAKNDALEARLAALEAK